LESVVVIVGQTLKMNRRKGVSKTIGRLIARSSGRKAALGIAIRVFRLSIENVMHGVAFVVGGTRLVIGLTVS
jgi:hypothetical protein